jgi:hypothetical protein
MCALPEDDDMSRFIVFCVSAVLLISVADAKTLYVNGATGNDATTYESNSASSPWRTIGRAAWGSTSYTSPNTSQAARAGDVVQIAEGIYWETGDPSGGRFTVSLNPVNNGTAGSPITLRGVGNVSVRMQRGFRGGMIGCSGRSYIIWDNFQIDDYYGGSTSDTGPVVFSGNARHCQLINSTVKGHPGSYYHGYPTFGGNYRGISMEPAHNIVIRNNVIHDFRGGQNEAGVMLYDSNDNLIENNLFYNNGVAVFSKGLHPGFTQARNVIRRNVVRNNTSGIRGLDFEDGLVYQNVIYNNTDVGLWAGFGAARRSRWANNTLVNNGRPIVAQGTDLVAVQFFGNIVASSPNALYNWTVDNPTQQDVTYNRNVYYNNARHAYYESGRTIAFSDWQTTYRMDLNGVSANPMFANPSANDFRLQSGSPVRSLVVDVLDLNGNGSTTDLIPAGAYVTGNETIGPTVGPAPPAPSPPASVIVE